MIITILGAGDMGSAMSVPARYNGHETRLVGTHLDRDVIEHCRRTGAHPRVKQLPPGTAFYQIEQLGEALRGADLVVSGVSSFGVDWFRNVIIPQLPPGVPVLSVTKGMLDQPDGSLLTFPELYEQADPSRAFCAVGGPCTSYEMMCGDPTTVCYCGRNEALLCSLKSLLETPFYHVALSTDVRGVECAVAMKNAYALAVCLAAGLSEQRDGKQHYNSQAALFGQSVREMRALLALCGGRDDNIVYGAGDLYVTVYGGRTRKIGTLLGKGVPFDEAMAQLSGTTLESHVIAVRTARAVRRLIGLGRANAADFPLLLHIDDIITRSAPVNIPWAAFVR